MFVFDLRSPDISCEAKSDAHAFECNVSIVRR